jgi:DNA adenine methylase
MASGEQNLKTPITYYGGKQSMLNKILPLIPKHELYCEPFFGGGAIYFAKKPSHLEVINDINGDIINFYKVLQNNFSGLKKLIDTTLHSRQQHEEAQNIYKNPQQHTEVERAWAVWILTNMSYGSCINAVFGKDRDGTTAKTIANKKKNFTKELSERFNNTTIECKDAIYIINSYDGANTFFYLDPPYYNSDTSGYEGNYTIDDYRELLEVLTNIEGKFLLSGYPSEILTEYTSRNNWYEDEIRKIKDITAVYAKGNREYKTEVLTANYNFNELDKQLKLF